MSIQTMTYHFGAHTIPLLSQSHDIGPSLQATSREFTNYYYQLLFLSTIILTFSQLEIVFL